MMSLFPKRGPSTNDQGVHHDVSFQRANLAITHEDYEMTTDSSQNNVVERVSFKLKDGVSADALLATNPAVQDFVSNLPGLLYRSVSLNPDTREWTDIVYWATRADAEHASQVFMDNPACQEMVALIDPDSIHMQHSEVLFSSCTSEADASA